MNVLRAFFAVNFSVSVVRRVNEAQRTLRIVSEKAGWDVKWVPPPNIHVVLRYLGDVGVALPGPLLEAIEPRARRCPPFLLRCKGVRADLAAEGPTGSIVVGVEDVEGGLVGLRNALSAPLEEVGFNPQQTSFEPRLVVGRVLGRGTTPIADLAPELTEAEFGESVVPELVLYRSDAVVQGGEFRDLFRVRLRGERAVAAPEPEPVVEAPDEDEQPGPGDAETPEEPVPGEEARGG